MSDEVKQYTIEELKAKLTEKERVFCHQYIIDWNGARSARQAGYSEDSARQIASDTLTKAYIQQYIGFIKNNLEEESGISKLRNLKELSKIAYSNIADLHDDWIELGSWNQIKDSNPELLATIESIDTKTEYRTIKTDGDNEQVIEIKFVKIKLYGKTVAIDMINKMLGYNTAEKIEHSGTIKTVDVSNMTTEELILRAQACSKIKE